MVQINGIWLKDREHKHVVDLFKTAGEDVELCVQKKVGGRAPFSRFGGLNCSFGHIYDDAGNLNPTRKVFSDPTCFSFMPECNLKHF